MTKLENSISNIQQKRRITCEEFINIWNKSYLNNPNYEEFYDKQYSNINVKFSNCDIIEDIVYKKNDDTFLPSLLLDNTTIEDLILIDFEDSSLHISNKTQIKNLTLRNTSTHIFCRKSLIGKIEIEGGETNTFSVENSTIGDISIDNSKTGIFFIEDSSTIGDLYIHNGNSFWDFTPNQRA